LGTAVANSNGSWSFDTTSLTGGTFSITARAIDLAGNTSSSSAAANIIAGTSGNGNSANNTLNGTNNNEVLVGYAGNDSLNGGNGNDILLGGDGNDTLLGGNGNDILVGCAGNDILTGGNGNDQFVYQALSDRGTAGDTITDFNTSQDQLVLTDLLGGLGYSGSNPLADGYLKFTQVGANTQVQIDQDGLIGGSNFNTLATLNNVNTGSLAIDTNVVV
jgi:Ca2+-binding RTX toxin-like protein